MFFRQGLKISEENISVDYFVAYCKGNMCLQSAIYKRSRPVGLRNFDAISFYLKAVNRLWDLPISCLAISNRKAFIFIGFK